MFIVLDEVKDILKGFLDRIEHNSANKAAGQSSTAESSARDSASQRSAEQSQRSSFKVQKFQVIKLIPCANTGKVVIHNVLSVN